MISRGRYGAARALFIKRAKETIAKVTWPLRSTKIALGASTPSDQGSVDVG